MGNPLLCFNQSLSVAYAKCECSPAAFLQSKKSSIYRLVFFNDLSKQASSLVRTMQNTKQTKLEMINQQKQLSEWNKDEVNCTSGTLEGHSIYWITNNIPAVIKAKCLFQHSCYIVLYRETDLWHKYSLIHILQTYCTHAHTHLLSRILTPV